MKRQLRVYLAIKYHPDLSNRSRIEGITGVLEGLGYETLCATRDLEQWGRISFPPRELMIRSFAMIDSCDILVADITEKGVGIGIEAGYAYARTIPVYTIVAKGMPVSNTLRGISKAISEYQDYSEIKVLLADMLKDEDVHET